jgi:3-hydroxyacyl-CoA dehydrogenase
LTETRARFKPSFMNDRAPLVRTEPVGEVALLTVDNPPVNATSHALRTALKAAVDAAIADPAIKAVVLIGAGRGFIAGADISEFDRKREAPLNPAIIAAMERSTKPVIAAIHGHALGGGLELAMGCHYRIATRDARMGQPEVKIGLTPGAGGTQRLPRLVGLPLALDMIVGGDPIAAPLALERGLIDAIVDADLRAGAIAFAEKIVAEKAPLKRVRDLAPPVPPDPEFFARARGDLARRRPRIEAQDSCVAAVEASLLPFDAGLAREAEIFAGTVTSEQSKALRYLFFAERDTAKVKDLPADTPVRDIKQVAVIGGGTMGSAIAICCADAGLGVALVEADPAALARAQTTLRRHYDGAIKRGLKPEDAERRLARIAGSTAIDVTAAADIVIEAVVEDLALKQQIFAALERVAKPGAILATNTSYLDVGAIAAATRRPESVIGLHFFAPATLMRVVEVIRAPESSNEALATGMAMGRKLRKIPVAARACDGFIGNRLLTRRWQATEELLSEGVTILDIDRAMVEFGFSLGPFGSADMAGLDISFRARKQRGRHLPLADAIVNAGRLGQKTGVGYYRYEPDSRNPLPDPEAQEIIDRARGSTARKSIANADIAARILTAMYDEGRKIVDEGVAERASDIDVIWVYGYGFPTYRGGPMFYGERAGLDR